MTQPWCRNTAITTTGSFKGLTGTATNPNTPISGIVTPNATTIIFHLTKPSGDFLQLLAMPATAPIPPQVGKCFLQPGTYGRDLISSGPYMIQGSEQVNISNCSTIKPMSGFNPTSQLNLVRNPNYVQSTDNTRANYVNGVEISVDPNVSDIFAKVQKGQLDGSMIDHAARRDDRAVPAEPAAQQGVPLRPDQPGRGDHHEPRRGAVHEHPRA